MPRQQVTVRQVGLRREMQRIFPGNDFKRLPSGHAALRSYYLLRRIGGVPITSSQSGRDQRGTSTPVIYCQNDLGGVERDQVLGTWTNTCTPGRSAAQRRFHRHKYLSRPDREYKEDLIHVRSFEAAHPVNHERI